ncbi:hypothetical protein BC941DRAFT_408297 [Chlamydoabsidia padenii]|nr:hypothetical protein BC941DRAFT_408297 [Chlamydoabsidia padenii]
MTTNIYIVTRLDRYPNKTPEVYIAGSYLDKEQAYKNAMILQLEQMLNNSSTWSAQAIQHRRDNIIKRCQGLAPTTTYQAHFEHLFPPHDNLFDDLCNVHYQVHDTQPLAPDTPTTKVSLLGHSDSKENTLVQELMGIFLTDDEEDLDNSNGEDDDDDDDEEEYDDDDDDDEEEVDLGDVDSEDSKTNNDDTDNDTKDNNEEDEMTSDDDLTTLQQKDSTEDEGPQTMVDEIVDDDDDDDDDDTPQTIGHKRSWESTKLEDDEIDELNDDEEEALNKRPKPTQ